MADLMQIGTFAAITRISVRMLRYYDERGLLRPAHVDDTTGYRYYHTSQAATAEVIRLLRAFEMPLDEIARVLESIGTGDLPDLLANHRDRIEAELAERRRSLAYLDQLISYVAQEHDFPHGEISMQEVEPRRIISRRDRRTLDDIGVYTGRTIGQLYVAASEAGNEPTGPPFAVIHQPPDDGDDAFEVEICLPITGTVSAPASVTERQIAGGSHATLTHTGPYESLGAAYRALGIWLVRRGLEVAGPPRETYLTSPGQGLDPREYRTELSWPVREYICQRVDEA